MSAGGEVSVVIPVRDGERYLAEAIDSVLGGTRAPAQVIVVDDGSEDSSASLAAGFGEPVRVLRQPPRGIAAATNRGLAEIDSELVGFVDADDLWTADKLGLQVDALRDDPQLDAVFGLGLEFYSPDLAAAERARLRIHAGPQPLRVRGTMLIRREAMERVGGFDESLRVGEFVDWHSRAEQGGLRSATIDRVVLHRRLHATNNGRRDVAERIDYVRVARAALHRRRAAEG